MINTRKPSRHFVWVGLALVSLACTTPVVGPADAGTPTDGGIDAGKAADAGSALDAGSAVDAGSALDAGAPADAGADAGATDAGTPCSSCGDGCVDPAAGEQCDDGNLSDLDGCDSNCQYEMITRMISLSLSGSSAPSFCAQPQNVLGTKVFTSLALEQANPALQQSIANASTNIFFQLFGVTGTTLFAGNPGVGVLTGIPDPAKGTWSQDNLDWWFLADPLTVSEGQPSYVVSLTDDAGNITAGPGAFPLVLPLFGVPAVLYLQSASISMSVVANPPPDAPAPPPAQLAPNFVVFQGLSGNGSGQGLCGSVPVSSLAQIPVPATLANASSGCTEGYTSCTAVGPGCNSMLDVFVGGCTLAVGAIPLINPAQPDVPADGTSVTMLTPGMNHQVPASVTAEDLDGYSSFFTFTAQRVHFTGQTCGDVSDCQVGQTCTGGKCQ